MNSLRSGVPSALVGEGMSKKLRPALTQMFAYLYLARVLNIFCSALGGITNTASVTQIFHEKKKKKSLFFFPDIFLGGKSYGATNKRDWVFEEAGWNSITSAVPLHGSGGAPACLQRVCDALFGLRRSQLNSFSRSPPVSDFSCLVALG